MRDRASASIGREHGVPERCLMKSRLHLGVRLNDEEIRKTRMNEDLENRADMNTDKKWSQMDLLALAN